MAAPSMRQLQALDGIMAAQFSDLPNGYAIIPASAMEIRKNERTERQRLVYAVLSAVEEIPPGRVVSYGQLARMVGRERNARLVGKILSNAEYYGNYPCHRVVNHSGRLAPCFPEQRRLLEEEGVAFRDANHVDMTMCQMKDGEAPQEDSGMADSTDSREVETAFRHRRILVDSLFPFGFRKAKSGWRYAEPIADGTLVCEVVVGEGISVRVADKATGDEYALWRMAGATGAFVGRVRQEVAAVLSRIAAACSVREVFKSDLAHQIADCARRTWGEELEYLWEKFPEYAVLRRHDNRKWYVVVMRLKRSKLGFGSDETVEVIDLRRTDATATLGPLARPGYHMNKKTWFTVVLDGTTPFAQLMPLLAASRDQADSKRANGRK